MFTVKFTIELFCFFDRFCVYDMYMYEYDCAQGDTAAIWSACGGKLDCLRACIEAKCDINVANRYVSLPHNYMDHT